MIRRVFSEEGFTLIEVLVAAVILVLAFTALATVFLGGDSQSAGDVEQAQVVNIADQQLELVRAQVNAGDFDALGVSADPSAFTTNTVDNTYEDPDAFAFAATVNGTTTDCYVISNNYDDVNAASFGTETPADFNQWSDCGSYGEPLEVLGASALVQEGTVNTAGLATQACPSNGSGTIYSPCYVTQGNAKYNVYTFVTDTFIGCGTGTTANAGGVSCPTTSSSGVVQATSCPTSFWSITTGTPCADARRVTVAVYPAADLSSNQDNQEPGFLTPSYVSTVFTNPQPSTTAEGSVGLTLGGGL